MKLFETQKPDSQPVFVGLEPTQFLPENTPMVSIKRNKNTELGHFGEMASWQVCILVLRNHESIFTNNDPLIP